MTQKVELIQTNILQKSLNAIIQGICDKPVYH